MVWNPFSLFELEVLPFNQARWSHSKEKEVPKLSTIFKGKRKKKSQGFGKKIKKKFKKKEEQKSIQWSKVVTLKKTSSSAQFSRKVYKKKKSRISKTWQKGHDFPGIRFCPSRKIQSEGNLGHSSPRRPNPEKPTLFEEQINSNTPERCSLGWKPQGRAVLGKN